MSNIQAIQSRLGVHLLSGPLPATMQEEAVFGIVHSSSILGVNFVRDFFSRIVDVTGGPARGFENAAKASIENALEELAYKAKALGANAVTNIEIDTCTAGRSMVMTIAYGTAVIARDKADQSAAEPVKYLNPYPLG